MCDFHCKTSDFDNMALFCIIEMWFLHSMGSRFSILQKVARIEMCLLHSMGRRFSILQKVARHVCLKCSCKNLNISLGVSQSPILVSPSGHMAGRSKLTFATPPVWYCDFCTCFKIGHFCSIITTQNFDSHAGQEAHFCTATNLRFHFKPALDRMFSTAMSTGGLWVARAWKCTCSETWKRLDYGFLGQHLSF